MPYVETYVINPNYSKYTHRQVQTALNLAGEEGAAQALTLFNEFARTGIIIPFTEVDTNTSEFSSQLLNRPSSP